MWNKNHDGLEFNSAVELLPLSTPAVETEAPVEQPQVENLGSAMFSIDGLMGRKYRPGHRYPLK
ncbi:hypothetical protein KIF59_04115 [Enterobacter cloacae subsp. cloacae]|nr:hypothetical protein [Enterobacter cloacae subsp. cloacae]